MNTMRPHKKSAAWLHFSEPNREKKVECLLCGQTLSVANKSTCSLLRHLKKKHPDKQIRRQISPDEPPTPNENDNSNENKELTYGKEANMNPSTSRRIDPLQEYSLQFVVSEEPLPPKNEDPDSQLLTLLCQIDKYNYLYLFDRCKEYKVNARQLKYLQKEHVRELIPITNLGTLAEFEYLFNEWKLKKGYVKKFDTYGTTTNIRQNGSRALSSSPKKRIKRVRTDMNYDCNEASPGNVLIENEYPTLRTYNDDEESQSSAASMSSLRAAQNKDSCQSKPYFLSKIIPLVLKLCQEKYQNNQNQLTEIDKRLLSTSIVEYFLKRHIQLSAGTFDHLAEQIVNYFPSESKLSWYDNKNTKCHGRLHVKFYNSQRRKVNSRRSKKPTDPISTNSPILLPEDDSMDEYPDGEMIQTQKWLKCNKCEDMDEVINMWRNSLTFRMRHMRSVTKLPESISSILNDWPSYTWPTGHFLLNIDFNHMYPKSESAFLERWFIFMNKISNLYEAELKDNTSIELFEQFKVYSNKMNTDSKEATLLQLLHSITKLSGSFETSEAAQTNSIVDSQSSVMQLIQHVTEVNSDEKQMHPYIFLIGDSILKVDRCLLVFRNIQYELSFSDAICACFQFYMVFKLEFPPASLNFWNFVSGYFFDIDLKSEFTHAVMDHIVNYLETA